MGARQILRLVLLTASYLLVLAVGIGTGFYVGASVVHRDAFEKGEPSDPEVLAANLEGTMQSGDDKSRAEALCGYLDFLDRQAAKGRQQFEALSASDRALTLARLSLIEATVGESEKSKADLDRSVSLCADMKWKECNAATLIEGAMRMNQGWFDEVRRSK
jgi:hypothetical protein